MSWGCSVCASDLVVGVVGFAGVLDVVCRLFGEFPVHCFRFLPFAVVGVSSVPVRLVVAKLCGMDLEQWGWFWVGVGRRELFERVLQFLSRACSSSRLIVLKVMTLERWSKKRLSNLNWNSLVSGDCVSVGVSNIDEGRYLLGICVKAKMLF